MSCRDVPRSIEVQMYSQRQNSNKASSLDVHTCQWMYVHVSGCVYMLHSCTSHLLAIFTMCGQKILYCTVRYGTVRYCTVLYGTVRYCTVLYCTVLYCTVLYCTVLRCNVLSTLLAYVHFCLKKRNFQPL